MRGSTARLNAVWLIVALSRPDMALTQAPFTFEFNPGAGMSIRLIIESQGEMVIVGVPDLPGGSVAQLFSLGSITRRMLRSNRTRRIARPRIRPEARPRGVSRRKLLSPPFWGTAERWQGSGAALAARDLPP